MNRYIITSGVVIMSFGILNNIGSGGKFTTILIGGQVFMLMLALADAFGGTVSDIASGMSLVSMASFLVLYGGGAVNALMKWANSSGKSTGGSAGGHF